MTHDEVTKGIIDALQELMSIVTIYSRNTDDDFAWAEMSKAKKALANFDQLATEPNPEERLEVYKQCIDIYLDALKWIEDHGVMVFYDNGKTIFTSTVARKAIEKAQVLTSNFLSEEDYGKGRI